jgi:hypothetical protein
MPTNRKQFNVVTDEVTESWIVDAAQQQGIKPAVFIRDLLADAARKAGLQPNPDEVYHGRRPEHRKSAQAGIVERDVPADDEPHYVDVED